MLRYPNSKRSMSLEDIIALLADPLRGVRLQELENKETGIKTIVFSGADALPWFVKYNIVPSRVGSTQLLQELMDYRLIVTHKAPAHFHDPSSVFYKFTDDNLTHYAYATREASSVLSTFHSAHHGVPRNVLGNSDYVEKCIPTPEPTPVEVPPLVINNILSPMSMSINQSSISTPTISQSMMNSPVPSPSPISTPMSFSVLNSPIPSPSMQQKPSPKPSPKSNRRLSQPILSPGSPLFTTTIQKTITKRRACNNCRNHHLKCSGESPCGHCFKKSIECIYTAPQKRGPKSKELRENIQLLQEEISLQKKILKKYEELSNISIQEVIDLIERNS